MVTEIPKKKLLDKINLKIIGLFGGMSAILLLAVITFTFSQQRQTVQQEAAGKGGNISPTPVKTPMILINENYSFRTSRTMCTGEDDQLHWNASGSLEPGESFTFTPKTPTCTFHSQYASAQVFWENSQLQLTSNQPKLNDVNQVVPGPSYIAPNYGNSASICIQPQLDFVYPYTDPNPLNNYSFTIKNVGTTTAYNIRLTGESQNPWPNFYYPKCIRADSDHDGWNDATEMEPELKHFNPWIPNYFGRTDFNNDFKVDNLDISKLTNFMGQGDGCPWGAINPDPYTICSIMYWTISPDSKREWLPYDIDQDGYVNKTDMDIVKSFVGVAPPVIDPNSNTEPIDNISPSTRIVGLTFGTTFLTNTIPSNSEIIIKGYGWDNQNVTKVEFYVNNKLICTQSEPNSYPYKQGLYSCIWKVPKRSGTNYVFLTKAYDYVGHVTISSPYSVTSN